MGARLVDPQMGEWQCKEWQHEEMLKPEDIKSFFRPFETKQLNKDFLSAFFIILLFLNKFCHFQIDVHFVYQKTHQCDFSNFYDSD